MLLLILLLFCCYFVICVVAVVDETEQRLRGWFHLSVKLSHVMEISVTSHLSHSPVTVPESEPCRGGRCHLSSATCHLSPVTFTVAKPCRIGRCHLIYSGHVQALARRVTHLLNQLMNDNSVCKADPGFAQFW